MPARCHRHARGQALALVEGLALPHQRERELGHRGKVAAGAHGAFLADDRGHAPVEHRDEGQGDLGPDARVAVGVDVDARRPWRRARPPRAQARRCRQRGCRRAPVWNSSTCSSVSTTSENSPIPVLVPYMISWAASLSSSMARHTRMRSRALASSSTFSPSRAMRTRRSIVSELPSMNDGHNASSSPATWLRCSTSSGDVNPSLAGEPTNCRSASRSFRFASRVSLLRLTGPARDSDAFACGRVKGPRQVLLSG